MPRIPVDVTNAGQVPPGDYEATVTKIDYQMSTSPSDDPERAAAGKYSWKGEHVRKDVPFHEWIAAPEAARRAVAWLKTDKGTLFYNLYMVEGAAGFVKEYLDATGTPHDKEGYDLDESINRKCRVTVVADSDSGRSEVKRLSRI